MHEREAIHGNIRRQADSFAVKGAPVINGSVPQRLEIRQLRKNNAQWNLYLLAMNEYQKMDKADRRSYYQLSGIHGRPFTEWDSVPLVQQIGYCFHTSNLFSTWHRPYMALFEQILYDVVQGIAGNIAGDTKGEYKTAAATFRHPYWDWAADPSDGPVLPAPVSGSPWIVINLPNGSTTISNPLYQFSFAAADLGDFPDSPFNKWSTTMRYPNSKNADAKSQDALVSRQIDQSQDTYSQRFMTLLQAYPAFANFSNSQWTPNSPGYDSLEALHNQIHGLIGNGGHMSIIDYAGFDPVFWLHHCQVDRLLAIWQALYPDSWVVPGNERYGSATIAAGTRTDENTPLRPFHSDNKGSFWTSKAVRDIEQLGYSYPEIQGKDVAGVKQAVNALYSKPSGKTISRREARSPWGGSSTDLAPLIAAGLTNTAPFLSMGNPTSGTYTEWIANIRVAKDAVHEAFFIHAFVGDFNPDPHTWSTEANLVGTHSIVTPYVTTSDPEKRAIVTGTIPLTKALRKHAHDGSFKLEDMASVKAYLLKNLHWRITRMDDTEVPRDQVADLKFSVVSSTVTAAQSDSEFPSWGEFKAHLDITNGRPGGLSFGEAL
ncbi:MAG: hypothetical protein LQ342_001558 [Letrouitia transgressa]|nr:MAG: hypothetical protein LQ342_001558 [Letrouitia transgressa]